MSNYNPWLLYCLTQHSTLKAQEQKDTHCSTLLADARCDISTEHENGETALHKAVIGENSFERVQCVLSNSEMCNLNLRNKEGYSPIHLAVMNDKMKTAALLLNHPDCDPNIADLSGNTPLHMSVSKQSMQNLKPYLMHNAINLNCKNRAGNTPLHEAVMRESALDVVKAIALHEKCNPSITNNEGMTPLKIGRKFGKLDHIEILVTSAKCKSSDVADCMETMFLLHKAASWKRPEILQTFLAFKECNVNKTNPTKRTALHIACEDGTEEHVQLIIQHPKCDVNIQDRNGDTALHIAVCNSIQNNQKIVILLSNIRCNPYITNNNGFTPLRRAIMCQSSDEVVANFLNFQDDNFSVVNDKEALHIECAKGTTEEVQAIISRNPDCDFNIQDSNGDTPLHIAVCSDKESVYKVQCLLLSKQCDLNTSNGSGCTPLHTAIISGKFDIAAILMKHRDCNPNAQDLDGDTPLHMFMCSSKLSLSTNTPFLMHKNINVNIQNKEGNTPLHTAIMMVKPVNFDAVKKIVHQIVHLKKCTPSIENIMCQSPLQIAVDRSQLDLVEILMTSEKCSHNDIMKAT